ncbi:MAG: glucosaminidase domain-containing protein [Helicobacteraceae bacterium]|jgi:hypothetical protein|nr:glucosaminidase domain-containing protein [Helicobacteraceae bacterium]
MRSLIALCALVISLRSEEFVRYDFALVKPFGGAIQMSQRKQTNLDRAKYDDSFLTFVKTYANAPIEHERLKAVTLAMMMLESGRGSSDLAKRFNNYGGLKFRQEMALRAQKVRYRASDGYDYYCKFASIEAFIDGFWAFLDRKPYDGWRKKAFNEKEFLAFIAPIYCPYNKNYAELVTSLLPEAQALLDKYKNDETRIAMTKTPKRF